MNLTELANRYGSDKGTVSGSPPHKYSYLYDLIFSPFRYKNIVFLEMGLAVGGPEVGGPVERLVESPSVQMWLEYFSDAIVFGFDISDLFPHQTSPVQICARRLGFQRRHGPPDTGGAVFRHHHR